MEVLLAVFGKYVLTLVESFLKAFRLMQIIKNV
jgi:hypothetical protein